MQIFSVQPPFVWKKACAGTGCSGGEQHVLKSCLRADLWIRLTVAWRDLLISQDLGVGLPRPPSNISSLHSLRDTLQTRRPAICTNSEEDLSCFKTGVIWAADDRPVLPPPWTQSLWLMHKSCKIFSDLWWWEPVLRSSAEGQPAQTIAKAGCGRGEELSLELAHQTELKVQIEPLRSFKLRMF